MSTYSLSPVLKWQAPGFFPGLKEYKGVFDVIRAPDEKDLCPKCGANVNVEQHGIFFVDMKPCPSHISGECQLGCGHAVFLL